MNRLLHPLPTRPLRAVRRATFWALVILAASASLVGVFAASLRESSPELETLVATYERLQPTIVVHGDVESAENTDIICRVHSWSRGGTSATSIKWVVDNGTPVKKGDVLVELDDSNLQELLDDLRGPLELSHADWVYAEQNCGIVASQCQGDIEAAQATARLAEMDLRKYAQGDYCLARQDVLNRLLQAESDLDFSEDRAAWSERMVRKGFLSNGQQQAEQVQLQNARLALDRVREELRVLERYGHRRMLRELGGRLVFARDQLLRLRLQAHAKQAQADVQRLLKMRTYQRRLAHFKEIEDEVKHCTFLAPHDGLVVYAVSEQAASGSGSENAVIAPGEPVRTGQRLLSLPNLAKLEVRVGIHEALVSRVHGETPTSADNETMTAPDPAALLLSALTPADSPDSGPESALARLHGGEPALVRLDAFPERLLHGHVKQVCSVACQLDSSLRDVRVYPTQITIDDRAEGVKPDMSAEVTVFPDEPAREVLAVPTGAVLHTPEQGRHGTCYVMTDLGPEERDVVVGQHSDQRVGLTSGVREGERVILHPETVRRYRSDSSTTGSSLTLP